MLSLLLLLLLVSERREMLKRFARWMARRDIGDVDAAAAVEGARDSMYGSVLSQSKVGGGGSVQSVRWNGVCVRACACACVRVRVRVCVSVFLLFLFGG